MEWKTLLAYITGTVDQELLLRNEYLVAENRILRNQIAGRVRLTDGERTTLAALGKRLGKQALAEVMSVVTPETLLAWHRRLIAKKFDGSQHRRYPGRPRCHQEIEDLVVQFAQENRTWGYDRIVGALKNVGYSVSDQTVGNILKRHDLPPAPQRKKTTTWREFIRSHWDLLVGTDFFTAEVWTRSGLVTYYILFFIQVASRRVHIAGMTPHPNGPWMTQMARNSTMVEWGFLTPGQHVLHDRDTKFCSTFQETLKAAGVTPIKLPARSPNLNAHTERWVRSVKEEALSKLILFGEGALRKVLTEYGTHYHQERNHQGKGNGLLMPLTNAGHSEGNLIRARERLGGLLKFYSREAA
ncbi:MAG: helix-turn-helix domain-containing protein [Nitrospirales bacterium]